MPAWGMGRFRTQAEVWTGNLGLSSRGLDARTRGVQLTQRAALNSIAGMLDLVARTGVELVINPVLVGGLGNHLYGAWRVLWRSIGSVAATTGRSAQALKWSLANRQSSTDYGEKRELVGSALAVWVLFLPLLILFGGGIAWMAPALLDTAPEFSWSVRWAALMLVAYVIVTSMAEIPRAILQGENLGYKRMGLSTALLVLCGALMALAAHEGMGIVGVSAANLVTALLTGIVFIFVVRSCVDWAGIARPTWSALRSFWHLSWWFVVWKFVMQAMLAGDVMVLGLAGSVESVTIYTLTSFAPTSAILAVERLFVSGMGPGLGGLVGTRDWSSASRVRSELMAVTWLVSASTAVTALIWNRAFIDLWVGPEYYAGTIPTLVILLMVMQFAMIRNDAGIIDLTLLIRGKVLLGLLSTALSLALAGLAVGYLGGGITGLCIGIMAGRVILTIGYPLRVGRLFGLSWRQQACAVLRPGAVTVVLLALALPWADSARAGTWPSLILGGLVTFVAVAATSFFLGLTRAERAALRGRLRKVFPDVS